MVEEQQIKDSFEADIFEKTKSTIKKLISPYFSQQINASCGELACEDPEQNLENDIKMSPENI